MVPRRRVLVALLFGLGCAHGMARADSEIRPGQTRQLIMPAGKIEPARIELDLVAGRPGPLTLEVQSLDLDTVTQVLDAAGAGDRLLAGDDDSGGPGIDRLTIDAIEDRIYRVVIRAVCGDWGGTVEITVRRGRLPLLTGADWRAAGRNRLEQILNDSESNGIQRGRLLGARGVIAGWDDDDATRKRSFEQARRVFADELGEVHAAVACADTQLGWALYDLDEDDAARAAFERTLEAIPVNRSGPYPITSALEGLAAVAMDAADYAAAEQYQRRRLELEQAWMGPRHWAVADAAHDLGRALYWLGRHEEAGDAFGRALVIRQQVFGADSLPAGRAHSWLAATWRDRGDLARAEEHARRTIDIYAEQLGDNAERVAYQLEILGGILRRGERHADAARVLEQALVIREKSSTENRAEEIDVLWSLAATHWARDDYDAYIETLRRLLAIQESRGDEAQIAGVLSNLVLAYRATSRIEPAKELLHRLLELQRARFGSDHEEVASVSTALGMVMLEDGDDLEQVEPLLAAAVSIYERTAGEHAAGLASALAALAIHDQRAGHHTSAVERFERASAILEADLDPELPEYDWAVHNVAGAAFELGKRARAQALLDRAGKHASVLPAPLTRNTEASRAWLAYHEGDYVRARDLARALLDELDRAPGPSADATLEIVGLLATLTARLDGRRAAEDLLDRRSALLNEAVAEAWATLGEIYAELGFLREAKRCFDRALRRAQLDHGARDTRTIPYWLNLLNLSMQTGNYPRAEETARQALSLVEEHAEPDPQILAEQLSNLAWVHQLEGRYEEATGLIERAQRILSESFGPGAPRTIDALSQLAWIHYEASDYSRAQTAFDRVLELRAALRGPDHPDVAEDLSDLAFVLREAGSYARARELQERAVKILEHAVGRESLEVANELVGLSLLLEDMEKHAEAKVHAERACDIRRLRLQSDDNDVIWCGMLVGRLLWKQGRTEAARDALLETLDVIQAKLATDHPVVNRGFRHFRGMLAGESSVADMNRIVRAAMPLALGRFGVGQPELLHGIEVTAGVLRDMGAYRDAQAFYRWTLGSKQRVLGAEHPELADLHEGLASVAWDLGRSGEALERARSAAQILDRTTRDVVSLMAERVALRFIGSRKRPETVLFSGLLYAGKDRSEWRSACWEWVLRRKALVLDELASRNRALLDDESEAVAQAWQAWTDARSRLASLWLRRPDAGRADTYRASLADAADAREAAERTLADLSERFRAGARLRQTGLAELTRALPRHTALVEYVRVPVRRPRQQEPVAHYVALVLNARGRPDHADLGPAREIDDLIALWHERLGRSWSNGSPSTIALEDLAATGSRLREAVWDPVAEKIGKATLVFVVPDGSLHRVNLSALPDASGAYLTDERPATHLLGTGRDLIRFAEPSIGESGSGVLILGEPDFDAAEPTRRAALTIPPGDGVFRSQRSHCGNLEDVPWDALPYSGVEAKRVHSLFEGREPSVLLTGANASEERFKAEAPGKRILHVATHGYFSPSSCISAESVGRGMTKLAGAALDSRQAESDPVRRRLAGENPLLLSGLVLAGANRRDGRSDDAMDDGILTAEEIGSIDMRGVELVVLSACDSGSGKLETGEGVFGLGRAFHVAGARTLMISLWSIPDRETAEWTEAFYRRRLGGAPTFEASRGARREMLDKHGKNGEPLHPYAWAGLQAIGDWH